MSWGNPIPPEELLEEIARNHLGIQNLKTQNSDGLDFHDVAVWAIKSALEEAYKLGAMRK